MSLSAAISPARLTFRSTTTLRTFARRGTLDRARFRAFPLRAMATLESNPLASWTLGRAPGASPDLPKWSSITPEHVRPAITDAVAAANAEIDAIEATFAEKKPTTWRRVLDPLERLSERLSRPWGVVSHLKGVRDSDALREAYDACQPGGGRRLPPHRPVPPRLRRARLAEGGCLRVVEPHPAQRRAIECEIRDAKLSGVALDGAEKERYNEIAKELSALSTEFSAMSSTPPRRSLTSARTRPEVAGLPKSALELARTDRRHARRPRGCQRRGRTLDVHPRRAVVHGGANARREPRAPREGVPRAASRAPSSTRRRRRGRGREEEEGG